MVEHSEYVGRRRYVTTVIPPLTRSALAALMDWPEPATQDLPLLWHWLGMTTPARHADLGPDGHERLGLFLPPLGPSVRMWAAGEVLQHRPLTTGRPFTVESRIADIQKKRGKAGNLHFISLLHDYVQEGAPSIVERQTLVYRSDDAVIERTAPSRAPPGQRVATYAIDDLRIFRYSALTFNSHRIHLDRAYCARVEGDDRLVVHGPLLATILARAADITLARPLSGFSFRAHHPVREGETIFVDVGTPDADGLPCWISGEDGSLRMTGHARAG